MCVLLVRIFPALRLRALQVCALGCPCLDRAVETYKIHIYLRINHIKDTYFEDIQNLSCIVTVDLKIRSIKEGSVTKKNEKGLASLVVHYSVADWPDVIAAGPASAHLELSAK